METRAAKAQARCTGALQGKPPLTSMQVLPKCLHCGAEFQTSKIHQSRVHPVEYHAERSGKVYSKCRWDEEESHVMAITELGLKKQGVGFVNIELHKRFQPRSLAAIRGHRRHPEYKILLQSYSENVQRSDQIETIPLFLAVNQ